MIYPIQATRRITRTIPVDRENPDHEEYWSKGEIYLTEIDDTDGVILGDRMVSVEYARNNKEVGTKQEAHVLFAHEEEGAVVIDIIPMRLLRINTEVFNKKINSLSK